MCSGIFSGALYLFTFSLISAVAAAQGGGGGASQERQLWCVAKNNADDAALQSALDWACGLGRADCGPIQRGGPCYDASDLQRTASYAFNDYFHKNGESEDSCSFSNTAALTELNPSHNNCKFPSSKSTGNGKFSGSGAAGSSSASADLSSGSIARYHNWGLSAGHCFFAIMLML